ncbi:hypothetical protein MHAS44199_02185 [Mycolicibacterium hassiacum DSM 44199]|nr:hypothetical protein [Mycolicibacterium hassiacum DSM 44199]
MAECFNDGFDLALLVLQHGADIAGDLYEGVVRIAGEDAFDRVE